MLESLWTLPLIAFVCGIFFSLAFFLGKVDEHAQELLSPLIEPIAEINSWPVIWFDNLPTVDSQRAAVNTATVQFSSVDEARTFYKLRREHRKLSAMYKEAAIYGEFAY